MAAANLSPSPPAATAGKPSSVDADGRTTRAERLVGAQTRNRADLSQRVMLRAHTGVVGHNNDDSNDLTIRGAAEHGRLNMYLTQFRILR